MLPSILSDIDRIDEATEAGLGVLTDFDSKSPSEVLKTLEKMLDALGDARSGLFYLTRLLEDEAMSCESRSLSGVRSS